MTFEYMVIELEEIKEGLEEHLDELGDLGWELTAAVKKDKPGFVLFMKRSNYTVH